MPMLKETMLKRLLLPIAAAGGGGSAPVEDTATGNPLVFFTDLARPLKSLLIPFSPQQSGTGNPSPQNIRPIVPWNGLTVFGGGKNLLNLNRTEGTPNPTTTLVSPRVMDTDHFYIGLHDANYYVKAYASGYVQDSVVKVTSINNNSYGLGFPVAVKGGSKYTFNCTAEKILVGVSYYDADWNFISSGGDIYKSQIPATKTTPDNASYMVIIFRSSVGEEYTYSEIQLEAGQTASVYEPYHPITDTDIVFPSPVYGGTLDVVSGVLTVEYAEYTFTGNEGFDRTYNTQGTPADEGYFFRWAYDWQGFLFDNWNVGNQDVKIDSYPVYNNLNYWYSGINKGDKVAWTVASYQGIVFRDDSYESADAFKQAIAGKKMVYKLASPVEIQLTPAQITALVGNNTIWSDADGEMTATYLKKA